MADRELVDEWRDDDASPGGSLGRRRRAPRGLHLQQIEEPGDEDNYTGIGTELRAARQRRPLTISDVSGTLRIQRAYLSALEEGRTDDLPGPTYAIGFLRTYSEFLGFDSDEIIRQYKSEGTLRLGDRRLVFPEPVEEARRPGLALALISLIVAGSVYGGWIFLERRDLLPVEAVAELPQRLAPYLAAAEAPTLAPRAVPAPPAHLAEASAVEAPAPELGDAAAAPTIELSAVTETVAGVVDAAVEAALPVDLTAEGEAASVTVIPEKPEQGEGERAAAADVSGLANTNDAPNLSAPEDGVGSVATVAAAVPAEPASEILDAPPPVIEIESEPAATGMEAATEIARVQWSLVSDPSPLPLRREGSDVDTAPAMPAIQTAIAPPPPPAAPSAPARPLTEGGGEAAFDSEEGRASLAIATESLGYRPQAYGASNRDVRVVLRARAESWVQIQGANNELLLTRVLRAGDSYHAPNRTDLVLMTGNAGAIEIIVDGEALGTLGPVGQVRRNIKLSADYLRDQMHASASDQ
jgi:cytoskeleton protein RodZ